MKPGSRSAKPMTLFSTLFVGAMVWTAVAGEIEGVDSSMAMLLEASRRSSTT
jgi:hypothetical protein